MWQNNKKLIVTSLLIGTVLGALIAVLIISVGLRKYILSYIYLLPLAFFLWLLVYCAHIIISSRGKVKLATHEEYKHALLFTKLPDKAVLYLIRPAFLGFIKALPIHIAHKELWLQGQMFYHLTLPAGTYTVSGNKSCQNELTLKLEAGEIYFVEQNLMSGLFKTGYQHVLIEDTQKGKQGVMGCKKLLSLPASYQALTNRA